MMCLPGSAPYTISKHAVVGITKSVSLARYLVSSTETLRKAALEARGQGIRVNAISPGFLLTDLLKPIFGTDLPVEVWEAFEARQGRSAKAEEVGDVAVLITSPRMSLVNGVNLFVDK
jgi:NAD(P)-dependent dehydrogenase (short-subunit alcohol dehydrogenase family)